MEQGQTLIGVLIATVLLTMLAIAITNVAVLTTRLLTEGERQTVALGIVNERIEFIQSLAYNDVGFVAPVGSEPPGIILAGSETVTTNEQDYTLTTIVEYVDDPLTSETEDYKKISVTAAWTTAGGARRESNAVTFAADEKRPLSCGEVCPAGRTCDPTIGFCLPDTPPDPTPPIPSPEACVPGVLCSDGSLCPLSGVCAGVIAPPLPTEGASCVPGHVCANGSLCPLSGVCPTQTCPRGQCSTAGDVCFSGFCYAPDWYELSFPADDQSGPGSSSPMMCQDARAGGRDSCITSSDCPATCDAGDGVHVVWQCEQTWVPDCRDGNVGGATASCRGGYDSRGNCSDLECQPEACPAADSTGRSYCANGEECNVTSSNVSCVSQGDDACSAGEICSGGRCRTVCADQAACSSYWGGYAKGCKAYAVAGAVSQGSVPQCSATALTIVTAAISADPDEVAEGDAGSAAAAFTVTLTGQVRHIVTVEVGFENGEAELGQDFTGSPVVLQFEPGGPLSQTATVQVVGDTTEEINESFKAVILDARSSAHEVRGVGLEATMFIINDDVTVSIVDAPDVTEGDSPGENQARFAVTRNGSTIGSTDGTTVPALAVSATVEAQNGTAESPTDFAATRETKTFAPSPVLTDTQTFAVPITGDVLFELSESFTAVIDPANTNVPIANSTGTVTIQDDDFIVDLVGAPTVNEGDPPDNISAAFTLEVRGQTATHDAVVDLYTSDGTAIAGDDYLALGDRSTNTPFQITINEGASTQPVSVRIVSDYVNEPTQNFSLLIDRIVGADVGTSTAVGTIVDDDPLPSISISDVAVTEGNSGSRLARFNVSLSAPYLGGPVSVIARTVNGTASTLNNDYRTKAETIQFAPGETRKQFSVSVIGDTVFEPDEWFSAWLRSPVNATLSRSVAVGTIRNDDVVPPSPLASPASSPAP